jgi:transcriptional regulator with XRE-family HTH domain
VATLDEAQRPQHPVRVLVFSRRLTYRQFAADIGYSQRYVESVLNGRTPVTAEFARRSSVHLGMPAEELFAFADDREAVSA